MRTNTNVPFDAWVEEQEKDPAFRQAYAALEAAYQVARLRIMRGLTQTQLAELVGTKQPSVARLESGQSTPRLDFLQRLAAALDARLEIRLVPLKPLPESPAPQGAGVREKQATYQAEGEASTST